MIELLRQIPDRIYYSVNGQHIQTATLSLDMVNFTVGYQCSDRSTLFKICATDLPSLVEQLSSQLKRPLPIANFTWM